MPDEPFFSNTRAARQTHRPEASMTPRGGGLTGSIYFHAFVSFKNRLSLFFGKSQEIQLSRWSFQSTSLIDKRTIRFSVSCSLNQGRPRMPSVHLSSSQNFQQLWLRLTPDSRAQSSGVGVPTICSEPDPPTHSWNQCVARLPREGAGKNMFTGKGYPCKACHS